MTTKTNNTATALVAIGEVLATKKAMLTAAGEKLSTDYNWSPATLAEVILDQDIEVFILAGVYYVTAEVAEQLDAFLDNFVA